jgi:hypothetical protein
VAQRVLTSNFTIPNILNDLNWEYTLISITQALEQLHAVSQGMDTCRSIRERILSVIGECSVSNYTRDTHVAAHMD